MDHRLVREQYIDRCDAPAVALYLFLLTVADAQGLSYYADATLAGRLSLAPARLQLARADLVRIGLIAYQRPLYQVLALDPLQRTAPPASGPDPIGARIGQLRAALVRTP